MGNYNIHNYVCNNNGVDNEHNKDNHCTYTDREGGQLRQRRNWRNREWSCQRWKRLQRSHSSLLAAFGEKKEERRRRRNKQGGHFQKIPHFQEKVEGDGSGEA